MTADCPNLAVLNAYHPEIQLLHSEDGGYCCLRCWPVWQKNGWAVRSLVVDKGVQLCECTAKQCAHTYYHG